MMLIKIGSHWVNPEHITRISAQGGHSQIHTIDGKSIGVSQPLDALVALVAQKVIDASNLMAPGEVTFP